MRTLALEFAIPFIDLHPAYFKQGAELYRDGIHPNALGQKVLAQALYDAVLPTLVNHRPPAEVLQ